MIPPATPSHCDYKLQYQSSKIQAQTKMASLGSWLGAPYTSDTWDNSDLARMNSFWRYKPETAASTIPHAVADHAGRVLQQQQQQQQQQVKGNGKKVQAEESELM